MPKDNNKMAHPRKPADEDPKLTRDKVHKKDPKKQKAQSQKASLPQRKSPCIKNAAVSKVIKGKPDKNK